MDIQTLIGALKRPTGPIDVVLDTDAYNEIDDQYAIAYLVRSPERARLQALYAAPFFNNNSSSPEDGMEKSYNEILHILSLCGREDLHASTFRGSRGYLPNEKTPVVSPAAEDLCQRAMAYSADHPLYVIAIGAITNIASALLMKPEIAERIVIVWLGGNAHNWPNSMEFNLMQDVAAGRVAFGCGVPLVQLPCMGVVSAFTTTRHELEHWLRGKNALCDYLIDHTIEEAESYAAGKPWSRVIWDVTAVAWLLDDKCERLWDRLTPSPIPQYDHHYSFDPSRHLMRYVYHVNRDTLMEDLVHKLTELM